MNSRERVLLAINHKEPDKVPLDLGRNQSGIHIKPYKRLLKYLDIEDKNIRYCDFVQQLALPCEDLLKHFEIDIRWLRPPASLLPENYMPEIEGKFQGIWDQFVAIIAGALGAVDFARIMLIIVPLISYTYLLGILLLKKKMK